MDKLRKIGLWIWYNKERMVLAIMFVALCFQVYKVWNPEPPVPIDIPPPARTDVTAVNVPPPPPPSQPRPPAAVTDLKKNPFSRWTSGGSGSGGATNDVDVQLVRILEWSDGSYRAQLRVGGKTDYYAEGEPFETYEVLSINADDQTVEIYSERLSKRVTLTVEG